MWPRSRGASRHFRLLTRGCATLPAFLRPCQRVQAFGQGAIGHPTRDAIDDRCPGRPPSSAPTGASSGFELRMQPKVRGVGVPCKIREPVLRRCFAWGMRGWRRGKLAHDHSAVKRRSLQRLHPPCEMRRVRRRTRGGSAADRRLRVRSQSNGSAPSNSEESAASQNLRYTFQDPNPQNPPPSSARRGPARSQRRS